MDENEERKRRKARRDRNRQILVLYSVLLMVTSIIVIIAAACIVGIELPYLQKLAIIYLDYSAAAVVLLICGIIGLFLGCFYCCLLQKDDGKVTALWATLLILFIAEFLSTCACFWYEVVGLNTLKEYLTPPSDGPVPAYLDHFQTEEECCGYNGVKDYTTIPGSCCPGQLCSTGNATDSPPFERGCGKLFEDRIHVFCIVTAFFAIVAGIISACGFVGACFLERRPMDLSEPSRQEEES